MQLKFNEHSFCARDVGWLRGQRVTRAVTVHGVSTLTGKMGNK